MFYILTSKGNPPTERMLVAIDLATGKEKWRVPHTAFGEVADTVLNFVTKGCVVVSKSRAKSKRDVFVLSASDGKVLYSIVDSVARFIVGGELWCSNGRYDLKSGTKRPGPGVGATYAGTNIVGGCVPPVVVGGRIITSSRHGIYTQFGEDVMKPPTKLTYAAVRGACLYGMVPANGMFYTAQNNCACFSAQIGGFIAVGPGGEVPAEADFKKPRPVEKGPAFGTVEAAATVDDWPTYRRDGQRSAGTSVGIPDVLKQLWKVQAVKPGEGMFAEAWNARTGSPQPLTAPIVVAGLVVLAGLDSGEVVGLNAETGAASWRTLLGSRIDTPPTYYNGLLLVGCHDGWAYALRGKDGLLAYRIQIAPREKRMVAHGMVESVWPAVGSVLIHDGLAYASAGRSTSTTGGIAVVAFKPESGETVWAKCLDESTSGFVDALAVRDGELAWHSVRLDPKTGNILPPAQKFYTGSMIDGSWMAGYRKRSGGAHMLGRICSSMMAWNDQLVAGPDWAVSSARAAAPKPDPKVAAQAKHPVPFKPDELAWKTILEPHNEWARVYAMAMTGSSTLFAGSVFNGGQKGRYDGSFIWVKSTTDGKTRQEAIKLDARPVLDGLAVSRGRVYLALQDGSLVCWGK